MKLRTQLIIAFLLLAVLPLTGIVSYSYVTSLRAVRQTVAEEAGELTVEMNDRLAAVEGDIQRRVERLQLLPLTRMLRIGGEGRDEVTRRLLGEMGDAASLVESFEFRPTPEAPMPPRPLQPPAQPDGPFPDVPGAVESLETVHDIQAIVFQVTDEIRQRTEAGQLEEGAEGSTADGVRYGLEVAAALAEAFSERFDESGAGAADAPKSGDVYADVNVNADGPILPQEISLLNADGSPRDLSPQEQVRVIFQQAREKERERAEEHANLRWLSKRDLEIPVLEEGELVGQVMTRIRAEELLRQVLNYSQRDQGEIPYALDEDGQLVVIDDADREALAGLKLDQPGLVDDWVIANTQTPAGLTVGIARPISEPLAEVQRTAARNFGYGLGLIGLALVGILPLSRRMTRNLGAVTEGAERIAGGDLATRVPVRSRDEIGHLARAFNDMAQDLERHQERRVEQELFEVEFERKTRELEEARDFQLSLLPKHLPRHPGFEIAVHMQTANEVGGDYYDFHLADDDTLTVAIGDATGHGARAGTMVTVVKSLFSAYTSATTSTVAASNELRNFLNDASRTIRRMALERMAMTLTLAELRGKTLTVAAAGMPPVLLCRRGSPEIEEIELQGMPLGSLAFDYSERRIELESGDTVLLMTDGFPELLRRDGEVLGYAATREHFARVAPLSVDDVVADLASAVADWTEGEPPNDDVTFVVIKIR